MKNFFLYIFLLLMLVSYAYSEDLPTIAVFDFSHADENELNENAVSSITSLLSSELFKTGKFTMIDAHQRDTLIEEMQFSMTGLSDEQNLLDLGKLLQAESIVTGEIGYVGKRIVLSCKLLETETAMIQKTADGLYADIDELLDDIGNIALTLSETENEEIIARSDMIVVEKPEPVEEENIIEEEDDIEISESTENIFDSEKNDPVRSKSNTNKVLGYTTLVLGVGMMGAGSYFLIDSAIKLSAVASARDAYETASSNFDSLYNTYLEKHSDAENSNTMFWVGVGVAGAGLISGIISIAFFSADSDEVASTMAVALTPTSFQLQISY